jgi:hypothetical protein
MSRPRPASRPISRRIRGDHGDACFIEDAMPQLDHLDGSTVPASNLLGQFLPEDRHLFAIRRANMRRKASLSTVFTALRSKPEEVGKLACCEPWHSAAVLNPPECQASVALEAVPPQVGDLESFAGHGLHGIPEDCLYMSDLKSQQQAPVALSTRQRADHLIEHRDSSDHFDRRGYAAPEVNVILQ